MHTLCMQISEISEAAIPLADTTSTDMVFTFIKKK